MNACGTTPVDIDLFIVSVRKGKSVATNVFSSDVGSGSMLQLFDGEVIMLIMMIIHVRREGTTYILSIRY